MPIPVVLDTSVLFPPTLRDTLLRCAELDLYVPLWSPEILSALRRNLITDAGLAPASAERPIRAMNRRFPEAIIDGYQELTEMMTNHPGDRHVLAAAVLVKAELIVTFNLRHFSVLQLAPHSVKAQSPDDFLMDLATSSFAATRAALELQTSSLRRPPRSIAEILARLETHAPTFATFMRNQMLMDQL